MCVSSVFVVVSAAVRLEDYRGERAAFGGKVMWSLSVKHAHDHCLPLEAPCPVVAACEYVPVTLDPGPLALA